MEKIEMSVIEMCIRDRFSMTMDQFDMKHAATLKQAIGTYLAIGGASQAKSVQAALAPHAQAGTIQQMGSALSRGFESIKGLLFSNGCLLYTSRCV